MNSSGEQHKSKPRLIAVAGFFGSGKTTALSRLGSVLNRRTVITTNAGGAAVDVLRLRHSGFDVQEIAASGFSPDDIGNVIDQKAGDTLLIEAPGGSLEARDTLLALQNADYAVAPLTVMVEPVRAARMLGIEGTARLSEKLAYVYRKQLEQASILLLSPSEGFLAHKLAALRNALERQFTDATVLSLGQDAASLGRWIESLNDRREIAMDSEIDPVRYAEAAAALAALNTTVQISSVKYFDGNKLLLELAALVQTLVQGESIEIAHLKIFLAARESGEAASAHVTRNDAAPELQERLAEPTQSARLVLDIRGEGDPELLHSAVNRAILGMVEKSCDLFARMEESLHFRPEPPRVPASAVHSA